MDILLTVPAIDTRREIPTEVIQEVARRIALRFQPKRIILFGSYAYGRPKPESDVDMLVIMDTPLRETRQALEIRRFLNVSFGIDILVYTPANLEQRLAWGDSFLLDITRKGKILYESANP